ncbi:uncharacterized protein UDID_17009 [Ustilago sp. UG-2017a]|nr:uncharacterized protein UDID_17009 [Ustilago sp. UG-2017a]
MGFDAIWISPVVSNVDSPNAYHGYSAQDLYSINSKFGTTADLEALSNALHARGMYLMIDVVANHMGVQNNVEQCRLGSNQQDGLPELNTENSYVVNGLNSWVKGLVGNYSADGLRVDTVKHRHGWIDQLSSLLPPNPCLPEACARLRRAQKHDQHHLLLVQRPLPPHQLPRESRPPRFPSLTSDRALAKNAITYILTGDGMPITYYGQEQSFNGGNDPYNGEALWTSNYNTNSEMYLHISKVNKLRKAVEGLGSGTPITTPLTSVYDDRKAWVYRKAGMVIALSSGGSGAGAQNLYANAGSLPNGQLQDVVSCRTINVGSGGMVDIQLYDGQPAVFYPVSGLTGSGICGR